MALFPLKVFFLGTAIHFSMTLLSPALTILPLPLTPVNPLKEFFRDFPNKKLKLSAGESNFTKKLSLKPAQMLKLSLTGSISWRSSGTNKEMFQSPER